MKNRHPGQAQSFSVVDALKHGRNYFWSGSFILWPVEVSGLCVLVAQLYPIPCDPMNCSLPGFSVYGILQARILEWIAIPISKSLGESF